MEGRAACLTPWPGSAFHGRYCGSRGPGRCDAGGSVGMTSKGGDLVAPGAVHAELFETALLFGNHTEGNSSHPHVRPSGFRVLGTWRAGNFVPGPSPDAAVVDASGSALGSAPAEPYQTVRPPGRVPDHTARYLLASGALWAGSVVGVHPESPYMPDIFWRATCPAAAHCLAYAAPHQDEWFDPDSSSTAKKLTCDDPLCNCGTPSCTCNKDRCYYSRTYAERSSSEGWMVEDAFGFPDGQPPVRMVFGCENGETGEIYRQMADGIMGMGNNHNAFQSQLVARGVIDDVFSLCFGYPKDGILLLGDVTMPAGATTVYTPLLNNLHLHYYNIKMDGITVGGTVLPLDITMFDRGYGVVLDSGTTFTYLPTEAFHAMAAAIGAYAESHGLKSTPGVDPQYNDICWRGASDNFQDLDKHFPPAEFVLGGGARLALPPLRYLFVSRPGEYCLGVFDNGGSGTLIGGVSVRDVVITYDRRNNRVGFTTMSCVDVAADLASRPSSSAAPGNVTLLAPPGAKQSSKGAADYSARTNVSAAHKDANREAAVAEGFPREPPRAFTLAAVDVNYALIIGVAGAVGALFMIGEVVFLGRNTLLSLGSKVVRSLLGGGGEQSQRDAEEATPLTVANLENQAPQTDGGRKGTEGKNAQGGGESA